MQSEKIIIKTKTNLFTIGIILVGMFFFSFLASLVYPFKTLQGTNERFGIIIIWIIFLIFVFFSLGCLFNIIALRVYSLTKNSLIVKHPLLFIHYSIPLTNIVKILEKDNNINLSRGLSFITIYKGKLSIIELINGKKIKFDSLIISNYSDFKKEISKSILRKDFK